MPLTLHHRVPLVRRPFWQRDQARSEAAAASTDLASAIAERDAARAGLASTVIERDAARAALMSTLHERNAPRAQRDAILADPLRSLPWYGVEEPPNVPTGRGMVHPDERRLLYVLARDYFRAEGRIIDGGTYLGSSSLALGFGLQDRSYPRAPVIDAFDLFIIDAWSVEHHLDQSMDAVKAGERVRHIYDRNIAPVSDYIAVHEGDVRASPWTGGPIEILFCDISKGWTVNDYILANWLPALMPGRSILIQQDQVQEHHIWVAITMEMLADHFEVIDFTPHSSMVYRPVRAIQVESVKPCMSANMTHDTMERAYRSFIDRFSRASMGRYKGWHLGMVEAGLVVTLAFHIGDRDRALHQLRASEEKFQAVPDTMARLGAIRRHLEDGTWCPGGITTPQ